MKVFKGICLLAAESVLVLVLLTFVLMILVPGAGDDPEAEWRVGAAVIVAMVGFVIVRSWSLFPARQGVDAGEK